MSNKLIADIGVALWGDRWQTDMSRALEISDRTIRNWVAGVNEPPAGVYMDLLRIVMERAATLDDLIEQIKRAAAGR